MVKTMRSRNPEEPVHLLNIEPPKPAHPQASQVDSPDPNTVHSLDIHAMPGKDPTDFTVLPLVQRENYRPGVQQNIPLQTKHFPLNDHPPGKALEHPPLYRVVCVDPIVFLDTERRMRNDTRKLTIIGVEDETTGKEIEAAAASI